jgi:hypothetical protein
MKIGVLGVGHLGRIHTKLIKELQQFELVGFYDPNNENAQKAMGERFYTYSATQNNCQDFLLGLLKSSNLGNQETYNFIKGNFFIFIFSSNIYIISNNSWSKFIRVLNVLLLYNPSDIDVSNEILFNFLLSDAYTYQFGGGNNVKFKFKN